VSVTSSSISTADDGPTAEKLRGPNPQFSIRDALQSQKIQRTVWDTVICPVGIDLDAGGTVGGRARHANRRNRLNNMLIVYNA